MITRLQVALRCCDVGREREGWYLSCISSKFQLWDPASPNVRFMRLEPVSYYTSRHQPPHKLSVTIQDNSSSRSMTEVLPQPNGHAPSPDMDSGTDTPPEIEATLARLSAYRKVRGVMILSRAPIASSSSSTRLSDAAAGPSDNLRVSGILRRSGTVFDGEGGEKYARAVEDIVLSIGKAVASCEPGVRTVRYPEGPVC